jgi:RNA polymerase sigma factor (sigma-70 family)
MTSAQYAEAYSRNFGPMVRAFTRYGFGRDKAEDLVQSAWLRGWERLEQLRDDGLVVWWVNRIATNKLRDDFRSSQRVRQLKSEDMIAVEPHINIAAIDAERVLQLCDDERQRMMCSSVYIDERPTPLVAREMGISREALNSALARTRRVLRKKLVA